MADVPVIHKHRSCPRFRPFTAELAPQVARKDNNWKLEFDFGNDDKTGEPSTSAAESSAGTRAAAGVSGRIGRNPGRNAVWRRWREPPAASSWKECRIGETVGGGAPTCVAAARFRPRPNVQRADLPPQPSWRTDALTAATVREASRGSLPEVKFIAAPAPRFSRARVNRQPTGPLSPPLRRSGVRPRSQRDAFRTSRTIHSPAPASGRIRAAAFEGVPLWWSSALRLVRGPSRRSSGKRPSVGRA